jgi:alkanesulfonate monooxygenase SsuD/methylene tetrahydromethanopterin reductase-like flavin-dependent oxidoreductase (luciferase family)
MKKDAKQLTDSIIAQILELAKLADGKTAIQQVKMQHGQKGTTGATGGLRILVDEGYFGSPKQLAEIIERLKQEGRHYSDATISMGLLNLVKERVLMRFRDKGDKKWKYIIRK